MAKPEYFKNYGQKRQGWARKHGKTISRVSYAIIVAFIILYAVVIWKQVLDIPNYISGNFETVSGVVWKTESNGYFITLEDGSNYTVDLKGIERGDNSSGISSRKILGGYRCYSWDEITEVKALYGNRQVLYRCEIYSNSRKVAVVTKGFIGFEQMLSCFMARGLL